MSIFGKLKSKAMGALLKRQLKHLPKDQQDMFLKAIEKNPAIFQKIAEEIKAKKKSGQNEMYASMQVMQKYQSELQKVFTAAQGGQQQPKQKVIYK